MVLPFCFKTIGFCYQLKVVMIPNISRCTLYLLSQMTNDKTKDVGNKCGFQKMSTCHCLINRAIM